MTRQPLSLRAIAPALVVGLLGFLVTVDLHAQDTTSKTTAGRRAQLAAIIAERQRHTADLEKRLTQLRAQADALAALDGSARLKDLQRATDQIAPASGTFTVEGSGIVVELTDAPDADPGQADSRIQDVDIQAVVNQLWASGAEAVAVNGQRLVGSSAVRNAGGAVLVNFRVLTSPYRVQAIGDQDELQSSIDRSEIAGRFRRWSDVFGLGFTVSRADRLVLPPFEGTLSYRYAHPFEQSE